MNSCYTINSSLLGKPTLYGPVIDLEIRRPLQIGDVEIELIRVGFKKFSSLTSTPNGRRHVNTPVGFVEIRFTNASGTSPLSLANQEPKHYDNKENYCRPSGHEKVTFNHVHVGESVIQRYCYVPLASSKHIDFSCLFPIRRKYIDKQFKHDFQRVRTLIPVNVFPANIYQELDMIQSR